jgi:hypothetical protein
MFIIAQFFGILVLVTNVLSMQMKNKKQIIFMFILANLFASINFLLLQGYSGAIICFFSIIQTFINKVFEKQNKKVPKVVIGIYAVISIILGIITFNSFIDIVPIICSILYSLTIIQDKEKNIRKISLVNIILWVIYDVICKAYTAAISDLLMTVSTVVGMYRFDYKNKK